MTFDWNTINAQGPLFWIACGSVALGVAMIAAAAAAQVRRLRAVAPSAVPHEPAPKPEAAPATGGPAAVRSRTTASPAGRPATELHRRRLGDLVDRLERVAASLATLEPAELPAPGAGGPPTTPETPLKESSDGVEYVFRAAGG